MPERRSGFNTGDLLHLIQIAVLLISAGIAYQKFQVAAEQAAADNARLERIEHYLSSRDPEYWHRSREE